MKVHDMYVDSAVYSFHSAFTFLFTCASFVGDVHVHGYSGYYWTCVTVAPV